MKILIIEDEEIAGLQLISYIHQFNAEFEIVATLRSIKEAMVWFTKNERPDLIFSDIELLDGNVFELYATISVKSPIIFTTAYDQFLLRAFETNGIAYLLKPFGYQKVSIGLEKFFALQKSFASPNETLNLSLIEQLKEAIQSSAKTYKQRFAVKMRNGIHLLPVEEIAYFQSEDGMTFAFGMSQQKYLLNGTLNDIEENLNPKHFFRINRGEIINVVFIEKIESYFNDRLFVKLQAVSKGLIVSANRVPEFRKWLEM